ncbi:MAG TPA: suppressor of fused domain protein [Verrucomicrobiae bacterium]|nr:suppressor of fused domain protein [Verrucomicrobiae bacterium]
MADEQADYEAFIAQLRALPRPAMDLTTPEGAILCLEDAYRRRDIEAAVACKDFEVEAVLLLVKTQPDLANDPEIQAKTAEVLELGFRKEKTGNWPEMDGMESFFAGRRPGFQDLAIVIVTEYVLTPDGSIEENHLQVCKRGNEWKVLSAVEADSEDSRVQRHYGWEGDKALPETTGKGRDAIARHVEAFWGPSQFVLPEGEAEFVQVGVHIVPATPERPYHTLITSGMSDRAMMTPEGAEEYRFAELVISLPADWPLDAESLASEEYGWPLQQLLFLARMPHQFGTWLFGEHTVPNGETAEPFASNTEFGCVILATPVLCQEGGDELKLDDESTIHFLSVIPIYREEMEFALNNSSGDLLEKLGEADVSELLDVNRKNVCA